MRFPCDTEVTAILSDLPRRVRFVNISTTGARIEGLGRAPRDALVTLAHLSNRISARVVWTNDRQAGLRFVLPLSPAQMDALRGVAARRPGQWGPPAPSRFRELT